MSRLNKKRVKRGKCFPKVTVVIPVHDEERQIETKVRNCLNFDYPPEKLNIIVASDHSADDTEKVVRQMDSVRVGFAQLPFRGGKVAAQNSALLGVESEIIVFTDVAVLNEPDSINLAVQNFSDPTVGAVSCEDVGFGDMVGKGVELRSISYETWMRGLSSGAGMLIEMTGGFYAVRSEIAQGGWNPAFLPSFYAALRTIKRGLRVITDPCLTAHYRNEASEWKGLKRKICNTNREMHSLLSVSNAGLLNPFRWGIVSVVLISSKVLRWLTPVLIFALYITSALLANQHFFVFFLFACQTLFFAVALAAYFLMDKKTTSLPITLIRDFVIFNVAMVVAWCEFLVRKTYVMWEPTKR
jgi:cellulose synthase/poly-beta-1,6-N-acetylglucosamine synthase-like glycosyltransferase